MNVFVLNESPELSAQEQCDKHVVKMPTESAQMLSTAHRLLDGELMLLPVVDDDGNQVYLKSGKPKTKKHWDLYRGRDDLEAEMMYYKAVHMAHPCTIWTMESEENYRWHWEHFFALCEEYTYRYGRIHGAMKLLHPLRTPPRNIPKGVGMTPFPLAMKSNPECMFPEDPIKSYRMFYQTKQDRFKMTWTARTVPEWFERRAA